MSLKRKTFSGVAWLSFANLANQVVSFLVFVILARDLEFHEFGLVMLAVLVINLFTMFFKVGLVEYLVRLKCWEEPGVSTAFWLMVIAGCALTALIAGVIGPQLERVWGGNISAYVGAMSPVILIGCLTVVNAALLRRHFRFRVSAFRNFGNGLLAGIIAVAMALAGCGAWSLVLSRVVGAVGGAVILWAAEPYRPRLTFSLSHAWRAARFSVPILASRLMTYLASKMPELVLGALIGPAALAVYRVGARILDMLNTLFLDSITNVLVTTFSKVGADGIERALRRVLAALAAVMVPVFIGCAVMAPQLNILFYGSKWQESGWVMMLLCLQIGPLLVRSVLSVVYTSAGKGVRLSWLAGAELSLCAVVTFGAAFLGPTAVACGMLVSVHLIAALFLWAGRRDLGVSAKAVLFVMHPFIISATAMGLCVLAFNLFVAAALPPLSQLLGGAAIGALLYALFLMLFFPMSARDLLEEAAPVIPRRLTFASRLAQALLCVRTHFRTGAHPLPANEGWSRPGE